MTIADHQKTEIATARSPRAAGFSAEQRSPSLSYEQLRHAFAPRSIAIVGAKDNATLFMGSGAVLQGLERLGFDGDLYLVNRSGSRAFGRSTTRTVAEIGKQIDMAALVVPAAAVTEVLPDLAKAGVRAITLLAGGFSETGAAGKQLEARMIEEAAEYGITVLGPNCLGFINFIDSVGVWFSGLPTPPRRGHVGIVSQSGGVGDALLEAAHNLGVGLSYVITTGNESMVSTCDALLYLVEDPSTRAVIVYAEGLPKPEVFIRAAHRARTLKKAIVIVKGGSSAKGARNAVSHTGSLVGDDGVTHAVFRQLGVVRVATLEQALTTAQVIAEIGVVDADGVGVVSLSGGSAGLIADIADSVGLSLPDFTAETSQRLKEVAPPVATVQNPFDVTGAADETTFERVLDIAGAQPDIGVLAVLCNVPTHLSGATPDVVERLESIGRGIANVAVPSVLISQTSAHLHSFGREIVERAQIPIVLPGIPEATFALAKLMWWSQQLRRSDNLRAPQSGDASTGIPLSEWQSRLLLEADGVKFAPARLAHTGAEAVDAWRVLGAQPVAVKVSSPEIPHKSDIGAVVLGPDSVDEVERAFDVVTGAAREHQPRAAIEGALVSPMRSGGVELIVGVHRDVQWGLCLVVGLGGVLVETLNDSAVRVLPVERDEVREMLEELAGYPVMLGTRGRPAVNIEEIISNVVALAKAATRLGSRLVSAEINPLLATEDRCEGLDALVVVADNRPSSTR